MKPESVQYTGKEIENIKIKPYKNPHSAGYLGAISTDKWVIYINLDGSPTPAYAREENGALKTNTEWVIATVDQSRYKPLVYPIE